MTAKEALEIAEQLLAAQTELVDGLRITVASHDDQFSRHVWCSRARYRAYWNNHSKHCGGDKIDEYAAVSYARARHLGYTGTAAQWGEILGVGLL